MESTVLAVIRGGSLSGSTVLTKKSIGASRHASPSRSYRRASRSRYVSRVTGAHLGSWSRIHDSANQSSHTTDASHSGTASVAGVVIRNLRKKHSTTRRRTMTMRYGLIWLDGIGTLRHRGCRASASSMYSSSFFSSSSSLSSWLSLPLFSCLVFHLSMRSFHSMLPASISLSASRSLPATLPVKEESVWPPVRHRCGGCSPFSE